ncbi:hypothetical protein ZIOFF_009558 [Zingiber officinale]|uniref:Uncharacterized protein n=1 Tax=Zingiber officinale TaxID=94328 RepID=A0A8J5HHI4_ZINOF|nr:hypothetical protein ZIOFF_009558 [Zingiber officinale]
MKHSNVAMVVVELVAADIAVAMAIFAATSSRCPNPSPASVPPAVDGNKRGFCFDEGEPVRNPSIPPTVDNNRQGFCPDKGPPVRNLSVPPTVDGNMRLLPTFDAPPSHLRREILLRLRRSSSNILLRFRLSGGDEEGCSTRNDRDEAGSPVEGGKGSRQRGEGDACCYRQLAGQRDFTSADLRRDRSLTCCRRQLEGQRDFALARLRWNRSLACCRQQLEGQKLGKGTGEFRDRRFERERMTTK